MSLFPLVKRQRPIPNRKLKQGISYGSQSNNYQPNSNQTINKGPQHQQQQSYNQYQREQPDFPRYQISQ